MSTIICAVSLLAGIIIIIVGVWLITYSNCLSRVIVAIILIIIGISVPIAGIKFSALIKENYQVSCVQEEQNHIEIYCKNGTIDYKLITTKENIKPFLSEDGKTLKISAKDTKENDFIWITLTAPPRYRGYIHLYDCGKVISTKTLLKFVQIVQL